jgi:hypothetical protein
LFGSVHWAAPPDSRLPGPHRTVPSPRRG